MVAQPRIGGPAITSSNEQMRRQFDQQQVGRAAREQSRAAANESPERRERAARLSAMANGGQCPEAIAIARQEGDADMAERLTDACRAGTLRTRN
jgi:hypothetical protein